jgi:molecular chaperone GrpE (heat shock protein)
VTPIGGRFDPSLHSAEGATPTSEEHLVGTIAVVDAPGYADRGVLLRPPTVTVYQPAPADVPKPKKARS